MDADETQGNVKRNKKSLALWESLLSLIRHVFDVPPSPLGRLPSGNPYFTAGVPQEYFFALLRAQPPPYGKMAVFCGRIISAPTVGFVAIL